MYVLLVKRCEIITTITVFSHSCTKLNSKQHLNKAQKLTYFTANVNLPTPRLLHYITTSKNHKPGVGIFSSDQKDSCEIVGNKFQFPFETIQVSLFVHTMHLWHHRYHCWGTISCRLHTLVFPYGQPDCWYLITDEVTSYVSLCSFLYIY